MCTPSFIHTVSLLGSKWEKKISRFRFLIKVHFYVENSNREDSESLTLFPCMFKVRIHEMRCRNTG